MIKYALIAVFVYYVYGAHDADEKRPYEFGFKIEGEQHRYEKKDINGIIQGEFGFITADGIYHVTVYATDEKGNFRILKMKNIRLSEPLDKILRPFPGMATPKLESTFNEILENSTPKQFSTLSTVAIGCSGCGIVTKAPPKPLKSETLVNNVKGALKSEKLVNNVIGDNQVSLNKLSLNDHVEDETLANEPLFIKKHVSLLNTENINSSIKVTPNKIIVPGNPPIHFEDRYPNMQNGLPQGITKQNISDFLYKFNYTVGFHGHYEHGFKNGAKIGGYFFNGRDGYSRVVTYVADEGGYRSRFRLVYLGLDSPDTPKPENEKGFALKSFEFVWYPIV